MTTTKPPVLTDEEIRTMGETIRDEQYNEFYSWGQGYRRDGDGRFTIPLLPHILPKFARAIEQAVLERAGADVVPVADCWSDNEGDSWRDSPEDCDFLDGLKVGDEYELQASIRSWPERFRVTKVPDDVSDDYAVEPVDIRALKGTPAAAVADAQVVSNIRVGNLPTMNQDEYPGLGDWWVQLRIGADSDEVLARVYGNSPQQAVERARRLAAQPSAQAQPSVNAGEVADHEWIEVPEIGNYYGCLRVKREQGVDYWSIENYNGDHWYECDPAVANAIRAAIAASKGAKP